MPHAIKQQDPRPQQVIPITTNSDDRLDRFALIRPYQPKLQKPSNERATIFDIRRANELIAGSMW